MNLPTSISTPSLANALAIDFAVGTVFGNYNNSFEEALHRYEEGFQWVWLGKLIDINKASMSDQSWFINSYVRYLATR